MRPEPTVTAAGSRRETVSVAPAPTRELVLARLRENRQRRDFAQQARAQLPGLLALGRSIGVPIAHMAREAELSRQSVYDLLRDASDVDLGILASTAIDGGSGADNGAPFEANEPAGYGFPASYVAEHGIHPNVAAAVAALPTDLADEVFAYLPWKPTDDDLRKPETVALTIAPDELLSWIETQLALEPGEADRWRRYHESEPVRFRVCVSGVLDAGPAADRARRLDSALASGAWSS